MDLNSEKTLNSQANKLNIELSRRHQESLTASIAGPMLAANSAHILELEELEANALIKRLVAVSFRTAAFIMSHGREPGDDS